MDKVEKRLNRSTSEVIDGANNQGTTVIKVSKRSVVDMAFKPTSKVAVPSKTSWSPPRTKTLWSTKVVPYIGNNVVT